MGCLVTLHSLSPGAMKGHEEASEGGSPQLGDGPTPQTCHFLGKLQQAALGRLRDKGQETQCPSIGRKEPIPSAWLLLSVSSFLSQDLYQPHDEGSVLSLPLMMGKTSQRDYITKLSDQRAGRAGLLRQDLESSVGLPEQDSVCTPALAWWVNSENTFSVSM